MADAADESPASAPEGASPEAVSEAPAAAPQTEQPTAELAQLRNQFSQLHADNAQMRNYILSLAGQIQAQATTALQGDPEETRAKVREQFEKDPEAALDAFLAQRLGPIERERAAAQAGLARAEAVRQLQSEGWGDEWKAYERDVDGFMVDVPLDRQLTPEAWKTALQLRIIGSGKFDELALKRAEKRLTREREAATEGASPSRMGPRGPMPLTSEEKRMAKAFGMSEEEYQGNKLSLEKTGV